MNKADAIDELRAALAELEAGEGVGRFAGGHGFQSRVFEFQWREPALSIDIRLPYARVLSDEETRASDDAEIGAAIRMSILLLSVCDSVAPGSKIAAQCDESGSSYQVFAADGELEDSGGDWTPLVRRLEALLGHASGDVVAIWP